MAAINKKLIHFNKLSDFELRLQAGDILNHSIVFIKDAKKIWTHSEYYSNLDDVLKITEQSLTEEQKAQVKANLGIVEGEGITDAPSDGEQYARKNGEWSKFSIPTKTSELTNDSNFLTSHQDISHLATKTELSSKQDVISDLSTIRSNASKGATALQDAPKDGKPYGRILGDWGVIKQDTLNAYDVSSDGQIFNFTKNLEKGIVQYAEIYNQLGTEVTIYIKRDTDTRQVEVKIAPGATVLFRIISGIKGFYLEKVYYSSL